MRPILSSIAFAELVEIKFIAKFYSRFYWWKSNRISFFFIYKFFSGEKFFLFIFFLFPRKFSLEITFWDWCHKRPLCVLTSKLSFSLLCGTLIEKKWRTIDFFSFSQHFYVIELSLSEILLLCIQNLIYYAYYAQWPRLIQFSKHSLIRFLKIFIRRKTL